MFKITVEATTKQDQEKIDLLLDTLCYLIDDGTPTKLSTKGFKWRGYSGGDNSWYGLEDRPLKVIYEGVDK